MQYMLNLFYDYLRDKTTEYFNSINLEEGMRYNLNFDDENKVKEMYESFKRLDTTIFKYESYETIQVPLKNNKSLIIAATIDGITSDYMTKLRNLISEKKSSFEDKAILFLHNSMLDSLIGGSESLTKAGLPLNIRNIKKDIEIKSKELSLQDQEIIKFSLENFINSTDTSLSLFEYEYMLKVIDNKKIEVDNYQEFDLFPDPELDTYVEIKEIKNRIRDNNELFKEILFTKKYGDLEKLNEKYDSEIINKIKNDEELTYGMLKISIDKKNKADKLTYKEGSSRKDLKDGVIYWEKSDGNTKSKNRKRNILIFNPEKTEEIELCFSFEERLIQKYLEDKKYKILNISTSGSTLKVKINPTELCKYEVLKIGSDRDKYEFRFLVINVTENYFENLKEKWVIKNGKIYITTDKTKLIFNEEVFFQEHVELDDQKENRLKGDLQKSLVIDFIPCENEISFEININNDNLKFIYREEAQRVSEITGVNLWILKNNYKKDFNFTRENFKDENKVTFESREYYTKKELQKFIIMEQEIIKSKGLYFIKSYDDILLPQTLEHLPFDLTESYLKLIEYFDKNNLIPSFSYINVELKTLYLNYIKSYFKALEIKEFQKKYYVKDLMNLGKIIVKDNEQEIYLTPLHPLNVLYQLELQSYLDEDKPLSDEVVKHLKSSNLLPYIFKDNILYKVFDQSINLEWKIYIPDSSQRYNSSRDYIKGLVKKKIEEFKKHFLYLFEINKNSPLRLNLINMGDCREVLIGVLDYIKSIASSKGIDSLSPIEINIYSHQKYLTIFEEMNIYRTAYEIEKNLNLDLECKDYTNEEILEIYRNKVNFYIKGDSNVEYGHITFYEMDRTIITTTYDDMNKLNTGLSLDGIVSTLFPNYIGQAYKNGFGLKGALNNNLIELAKYYNTISRIAENQDPYNEHDVIVTSISEEKISKLNEIYDNSYWVTFIEPKVDINFFKEQDDQLLIIHYSDQYTPTSNYDAITVTKNTKIYEDILANELKTNLNLEDSDYLNQFSKKLINQFNSINGEWLLKFSRINNKKIPKEKISILSSIKYGLKLLKSLDKNFIWIPISLEEILRVTGSAGLSQNEGILSKKNLRIEGVCTDDLLFVGIKCEENIKICLYPVEVKAGINNDGTINKAYDQGLKLVKKLEEIFTQKDFVNKFYRNFFIQIIYSAIEKYLIYNFENREQWNNLLDIEIKTKLWNDQYEYITYPLEQLGKFGIFSFERDCYNRKSSLLSKFEEGIEIKYLLKEFTEKDGYNFINYTDEKLEKLLNNSIEIMDESSSLKDKVIVENATSNQSLNKTEKTECEYRNDGMKIIFGKKIHTNHDYVWNPNDTNKLMHPNTGIIGTMGTGKTQFTKSLITQLYQERIYNINNPNIGILIFDYKGDYIKDDFVKMTNAKVYDPYHLPFNPLSIFNTPNSKPLLPLHTASTIKETLAKGFNLGPVQETLLRDLLMEAYENVGVNKSDKSTWDNPAPTFKDVYDLYLAKEDNKRDSLYSGLAQLVEYELFEPDRTKVKTLYDLLDGVVVIKLSGYDESIQNLIIAMTLDLFYSQMQMKGHSFIDKNLRELNKIILVDEADNFLSQNFGSIKKILKEGREFGVGTILSTQFLDHFVTGENDYTNYIETWIIHKVTRITNKEVKATLGVNNKNEENNYINEISELEKHYSLVKSGNRSPIVIKDLAFWELLQK